MTYVIAQPCVDVKDKACVDECPFKDASEDFFAQVGDAGGAQAQGPYDHDHPKVAALPHQDNFVCIQPESRGQRAVWVRKDQTE